MYSTVSPWLRVMEEEMMIVRNVSIRFDLTDSTFSIWDGGWSGEHSRAWDFRLQPRTRLDYPGLPLTMKRVTVTGPGEGGGRPDSQSLGLKTFLPPGGDQASSCGLSSLPATSDRHPGGIFLALSSSYTVTQSLCQSQCEHHSLQPYSKPSTFPSPLITESKR